MPQKSFAQYTRELYSTLHLTLPSKVTPLFRIYRSHPAIYSALEVYSRGIDADFLRNFFYECTTSEYWDKIYGEPYGKLYMLCFNQQAKGIVTKMLLEGRTDFLAELDSFKLLYASYHITPTLLPAVQLIINPRTFPFNFGLLSNITHEPIYPTSYQYCITQWLKIAPEGSYIILTEKEHHFLQYLNSHKDLKHVLALHYQVSPVRTHRQFYGR